MGGYATSRQPRPFAVLVVIAIVFLVVLFVFNVASCSAQAQIAQNRERLTAYAATSVDAVQAELDAKRAADMLTILTQAQSDGTLSYEEANELFDGTVLIGDSRTQAIDGYGLLSSDHVVSEIGISLYSADPLIDAASNLHPLRVVLSFGENDMILNGGDPQAYTESLRSVIAQVREKMPQAEIFVTSALPSSEAASAEKPALAAWSAYNDALRAFCEEDSGVAYIDTASVALEHMDLLEPDGIHFKMDFYHPYLFAIADAMYR